MNILIISEFFPVGKDLKFSGGVEARVYFMAKYLSSRNKITIITTRLKGTKKTETLKNLKIIRVGKISDYNPTIGNVIRRLDFLKEAIETGKKLNIDVVEGTNFLTHYVAKRVAINKKIPSIAWYPDVWLGNWVKNVGPIGLIGEFLERINLTLGFNAYIAISSETARKLKRNVKTKIYIVPCGIDDSEFRAVERKSQVDTIIVISRLTKYKNIKTIIYAFAHLSTKLKKIKLLIIGSGPQKNYLIKLTKSLKINTIVEFDENLSRKDLIKSLKRSSLYASASRVEGFGISAIEAAACGLPLVLSKTKIYKEITFNNKGAFLANPDKPLEFSNYIYKLLTNKSLYSKKSKEAIMLSENYNWKKIALETENIYKKAYIHSLNVKSRNESTNARVFRGSM